MYWQYRIYIMHRYFDMNSEVTSSTVRVRLGLHSFNITITKEKKHHRYRTKRKPIGQLQHHNKQSQQLRGLFPNYSIKNNQQAASQAAMEQACDHPVNNLQLMLA